MNVNVGLSPQAMRGMLLETHANPGTPYTADTPRTAETAVKLGDVGLKLGVYMCVYNDQRSVHLA